LKGVDIMRLLIAYVIALLFAAVFASVYKGNSELVNWIALMWLSISLGHLAWKISCWICNLIKRKEK